MIEDPVQRAATAIVRHDWENAARILRRHLQFRPDDVPALCLLSEVQAARGRQDRAEISLRRALGVAPAARRPRILLARLLVSIGRTGEALAISRGLGLEDTGDIEVLHLLASTLNLMGEQEEAATTYERLLEFDPDDVRARTNYGNVLRMLGRTEEAIEALRWCTSENRTHTEAFWALADLKTYRFDDTEIGKMQTLMVRTDLAPSERSNLLYALGKAMEDRGRVAEAFSYYEQGARLRASPSSDPTLIEPFVNKAVSVLSKEMFARHAHQGCESAAPVFVVGLPRSGSTLVEQILASHPLIEATMELPDLHVIARDMCESEVRARGGDYLDVLDDSGESFNQLGERYLAATCERRKTGRPFFIDKQLSNWAHAGLIRLILPNAKIIDVRRHPLACGWSCFKQNFVTGQSFTYDLVQLGRYYRNYVRLMQHMDHVVPGHVHRVIYEELVSDPDLQVRALLDHCRVPFEPACLRSHETVRTVRTSSSEQVRQPISTGELDKWKPYEPYLAPLKESLGSVLAAYPAAPSEWTE